jgi:MtaA/CmuA family methyltransferase
MTGLERTLNFIRGDNVDRVPFHPIIMRWAAAYAGVRYREFCTNPDTKCRAMIKCADDFDIDWVTVMSDPWAEASAFGIKIDYPEDSLPVDVGGHLVNADSGRSLKKYDPLKNERCVNRIKEIDKYRKISGDKHFIVGWIEGPIAEYVDLRGASAASIDLMLEPESVCIALDIITMSAMDFITLQVNAGAHCIGIGDAFCSQIGPELYTKFALERQKQLVAHIHNLGALAKLHICGNTDAILPQMISTGADIIDIDHLVTSINVPAMALGQYQVLSGKADPVSVIQDGDRDKIIQAVKEDFRNSNARCIVSAGCEITPGTSIENMIALSYSAGELLRII